MKRKIFSFVSSVVILAVMVAPGLLQSQEQHPGKKEPKRYRVIDLGTFGTAFGVPQGINNKSEIEGILGNQNQHEFLLSNGVLTDLGTLGGPNSGVSAFFGQPPNERGEVAGASETTNIDPLGEAFCNFLLATPPTNLQCVPFIWKDGVMKPLPTLGGTNGGAGQINNHGQIVGTAENTTIDSTCPVPHFNTQPVIWDEDGIHQLPTVGGDPGGVVDSINEKGEAVGATGNCSAASHAVLWRDGKGIDLGKLGGTPPGFFEATAINNRSQIVGFSDILGNVTFHAFLWQKGSMDDLGTGRRQHQFCLRD